MNVLDLFSGIGGFSLGLERAGGFRTVQFCEIDPWCRAVLAKHWPGVPIHDDIRTLEPIAADVVVGGFPCQDISVAGKGAGLGGARSGLWTELSRVIRVVRPQFAIVENVSALLGRGLSTVLGDLDSIGYDTEWHCIPASALGAPHRRDRIWIIAHPRGSRHWGIFQQVGLRRSGIKADSRRNGETRSMAHTDGQGELQQGGTERQERRRSGDRGNDVADASGSRLPNNQGSGETKGFNGHGASDGGSRPGSWRDQWSSEPDVGRVAHGVPARVDRLRGLGNSVVPQVVEAIGRAIMMTARETEGEPNA